jgi:hypothetical protein
MQREVFGFIIGVMFTGWLNASPWSDSTAYKKAIEECEKTLPRNEHCVVVAVPISKD